VANSLKTKDSQTCPHHQCAKYRSSRCTLAHGGRWDPPYSPNRMALACAPNHLVSVRDGSTDTRLLVHTIALFYDGTPINAWTFQWF